MFALTSTCSRSMRILSVIVATSFAATGCFRVDAIKPTELPKLNGSNVRNLGQTGNVQLIGITVTPVERIDGRTVEIKGNYDASIVRNDGRTLSFEHPVLSEIVNNTLTVKGSNRGVASWPLADVSRVDVQTYDATKTILVVVAINVSILVVSGLILWKATQ